MIRWFKVDCDLMSKPKFLRLCDHCESPPVMVAGGLVALWAWLHTYGAETDLSAERLERQLGLPKGLIPGMGVIGWAEPRDPGWAFRLAGPTLPEISEARSRAGKAGNASRWQGGRKTIARPSQREEEKRREEREDSLRESPPDRPEALSGSRGPRGAEDPLGGRGDTEGTRESSKSRRSPRTSPILWGETGFEGIDENTLRAWEAAAPACEISVEIARAHAWLLGQPPQKRKRNLKAFLTSWVLRAQERSAKGGGRLPEVPRGCRVDSNGVIRTPSGAPLRYEEDET